MVYEYRCHRFINSLEQWSLETAKKGIHNEINRFSNCNFALLILRSVREVLIPLWNGNQLEQLAGSGRSYTSPPNTIPAVPFLKMTSTVHSYSYLLLATCYLLLRRHLFVLWPPHNTKRCRLSWLTNSALVHEPKCGRGVAGSQPYEYSCAHEAQINFGKLLTSYLTYVGQVSTKLY